MTSRKKSKRGPSTATQKKKASSKPRVGTTIDHQEDVPVVGIAASAGGLKAFKALLSHLSGKMGMGFVLIQHLDPSHKSILTEILDKDCPLPVIEITDGMKIEPDHVYVIPPGMQLSLLHNSLSLLPVAEDKRLYNPADLFFQSMAEDRGSNAIGVVLSGTASDGTLGCRAIKEAGGITFAQDSESAEYDGMPGNAVSAGCIDFVLNPVEIAHELLRIVSHATLRPSQTIAKTEEILTASQDQMNKIFILLRARTGNDFSYYKTTTIKRRINRRMLLHKLERISEYISLMQQQPQEIDALFQDILINVTAFLRDPESFDALKTKVYPKLHENRPLDAAIRIWVPGCSMGQEAYSIAMTLLEYLGDRAGNYPIQIFGSDIDESAVEIARSGIYPETIEDEVSQVRLQRYFHKVSGGYQVNKQLRDMCVFAVHNVSKDPPFSRIDLISCRNLLIYLSATLQKKVLQVFHYALQPGGFLLLGTSETIGSQADLFALRDKKAKLYQKKSVATHLNNDFVFRENHNPVVVEVPERGEDLALVYDLEREADRLLLDTYVPPGVIVNSDQMVVRFLGRTWPYIEPSDGAASLNLYKIAHPDLTVELRAAIHSVIKEGGKVRKEHVRLKVCGEAQRVNVQVLSLGGAIRGEENLLVMFEPVPVSSKEQIVTGEAEGEQKENLDALVARNSELEREVVTTREYMQSIVEEQEGTNEELRSANEEIQSTNEELQSTNEELETAKEELQSANEELSTVNEELENRNDELARTNDDLTNLLASVNLPILMLGSDLRIRQFTQAAEKLLNLIDTDVGRPIGNIKANIDIPDLESEVLDVIDTMATKSIEVQDNSGIWYTINIRPYKTLDNRIDGAVMVFIDISAIKDIDQIKQSLARERRLATVVRDSNDAITVQDLDGKILSWNPAAERLYGYTEQEALKLNIIELVPESGRSDLKRMMKDISECEKIEPTQLERITKSGSMVQVWLVVSALLDEEGKPNALSTIERLVD
ncbi:MAG: chemotaxis protein CheR [gamma proteobacterium symbiont of Stewartia floridana]|nr:PAS domain-containing protein [Candidatus Thiodiazotropha taylori]RLW64095.1 MAG: chemotaxis protein CheR [gamma proteobacterium symbiont of Stewartia floridana]RLW64640.1 MAG: chemotaxis protein CheR [gamma proteobacterium symbiont of Stewartia floridana]